MPENSLVPDLEKFRADWEEWHAAREAELGDPLGWLSVFAIVFPTSTPREVEGIPGLWSADADTGITVDLPAGVVFDFEGAEISGTHSFGPFVERETHYLKTDDLIVEVSRWGESYIVRPRRPGSAAHGAYRGIPTFEPDPSWVIEGRFIPFPWGRQYHLDAEGGVKETYESPGEVEFTRDGQTHRLVVFYGQYSTTPGGIWLLFRDATSGKETYGASRSLRTAAIREDGTVILDFNRAMNMPCAFTDFTVCALPPAENTLSLRITAGEKTPYERQY